MTERIPHLAGTRVAGEEHPPPAEPTPTPPAEPTPTPPADPVARWRRVALTLVAVLVLAAAAAGFGLWRTGRPPAETSAEVGFARSMFVHHDQAVAMAFLVRDASEDPRIDVFAEDMIKNQAEQQGMMLAWLDRHGVPATSSVPLMGWMQGSAGHGTSHGTRHGTSHGTDSGTGTAETDRAAMGMASDEELTRLATSRGVAAELLFLELMTRHHRGALTMAEAFQARSDDRQLRSLADAIVTGQRRELQIMQDLAAERR